MAELATLARPYANAAFETAKEDGDLQAWSRMLTLLAEAAETPELGWLLDSPDLDEAQKAFKFADLFRAELNDRVRKFLQVLANNRRLDLIGAIAEEFEVLRAREERTLDVKVASAFPLSDEQEEKLRAALAAKFSREVNLTSEVDDALIGGVVIHAGDTVIDGSLRGRLEKLKETLQKT